MKLASELKPWELVCLPATNTQPRQVVQTVNYRQHLETYKPAYTKFSPQMYAGYADRTFNASKNCLFIELHELDSLIKNECYVFIPKYGRNHSELPLKLLLTELEECWLRHWRCVIERNRTNCFYDIYEEKKIINKANEINKIVSTTQYHFSIGDLDSLTYRIAYRDKFVSDKAAGY